MLIIIIDATNTLVDFVRHIIIIIINLFISIQTVQFSGAPNTREFT